VRKLRAVAVKELRQILRDPLTLLMLLGLPAFMLVLYGYAISFDVEHVALAVQDRAGDAGSRALVAALAESRQFEVTATQAPGDEPARLLARRKARAVLVIPADFARERAAGRTSVVQVILDGSDANTASALVTGIDAQVRAFGARAQAAALGRTPADGTSGAALGIDFAPRVWYNPELRSSHFLVPGLIGFIMMLTAVLSTALSVVREKERGTLEQLRVAPLRSGQLIVGKTLPYLAISLLAATIILLAARVLFGVAVRGSYLELLLATLVFLFGALGWGLLVSTLADTQALAFQIGIITSMLPAVFLSGFVFPIRNMPPALELLTHLVPARYFLVILRGIILKGAGLHDYWQQLAGLAVYTAAVTALASLRLARREA
jgi:ABC-2 type transport system permease protein